MALNTEGITIQPADIAQAPDCFTGDGTQAFSFNARRVPVRLNGLGQLSIFTEEKLCDQKLSMADGALRCFTEREISCSPESMSGI